MLVAVAILLGVAAILHVQGSAGHGAEAAAAHDAHTDEALRGSSWAALIVGFVQLVLLVVVLVWPRRGVLWAGAWSNAATAALDAASAAATLRGFLVAIEMSLVVLFLVLVEARARGRPVLGLREVSAP